MPVHRLHVPRDGPGRSSSDMRRCPSARARKASLVAEAMGRDRNQRRADTRCYVDGYFGVTRPYALPRA